jgi:adenylate cyclase
MGTEIERKFLVDHEKWATIEKPLGELYRQGYILSEEKRTVRIRVTANTAYITLKGAAKGISHSEYEYIIPVNEGNEILNEFAISLIEKTRYKINYAGKIWEVDVFAGDNNGLIVAEIELSHEDEKFEKPDWAGKEVSHDHRYSNSSLAVYSYTKWQP